MKHSPKGRRVTAREVARKLGVSVMTVSRAINNRPNVNPDTRRRVVEMARRLRYVPNHVAKSLVLQKTLTVGVIVPDISHSFFPEAIRGIEEVTYHFGYHLILMHTAEDARREIDAVETLESKRVDGILVSMAETVDNYAHYRHVLRSGIPLVFFDRCVPGLGASCVSIDDEESARGITTHLIEHGYTRLAHLAGPSRLQIARARLDGFLQACRRHHVVVDPDQIVESGFQEQGGYLGMKRLMRLPRAKRPRAVVAVNDPAAFGAMAAILDEGMTIPEDIALAGFSDDVRASLMPVPLTTVRQPAYEVGKRAAQKLFSIIGGISPDTENLVIPTEQVLRQSCGCRPVEVAGGAALRERILDFHDVEV